MIDASISSPWPRVDASTSAICDQIRGVASICVAAVHAVQVFLLPYFGLGTPLHLLSSLVATYAVLAFFVVSGFMISISVAGHTREGRFLWGSFLFARLTRIYPPLIAAVLISLLAYFLIQGLDLHGSESFRLGGELFVVREKVEMSWDTLLATLFLTYGIVPYSPPIISMDGPLWTLCYEFWFYIMAMLAINAVSRKHVVGTLPLFLIVLMGIVGRNWLMLMFLIVWCAGYFLGVMYLRGALYVQRVPIVLAGVAISASFAALAIGRTELFVLILEPYASRSSQFVLAMVGIVFTVVVAVLIRSRPKAQSVILQKSAAYSYTLYVVHFPLYILLFSFFHPVAHAHGWPLSAVFAILSLFLVIMIAALLSLVVEDKNRIRGWFGGRLRPA